MVLLSYLQIDKYSIKENQVKMDSYEIVLHHKFQFWFELTFASS